MWSSLSKWFGLIREEEDDEIRDARDGIQTISGSDGTEGSQNEREWKEFDGIVTSLHSTYGLIDCEVFFTQNDVSDGVMPEVGDKVHVKASRKHKVGGWKADFVCRTAAKLWDNDDETDDEFEDKTNEENEVERSEANLKRIERLKEKRAKKKALLEELLSDKREISITHPVNFGQVEIGDTKSLKLEIKNGGTSSQVLFGWSLDRTSGSSQFEISPIRLISIDLKQSSRKAQETLPMTLEAGQIAVITIYCNARYLGLEEQMIVFEFDEFKIGRKIEATVTDASQFDLQPTAPYQKSQATGRYQQTKDSWIVPGQRLNWQRSGAKCYKQLPQYPVPESLRNCVLEQKDVTCLIPVLNKTLSPVNYAARFSALLFLEEIQQDIDIRDFDLEQVKMGPHGEFLSLQVPGLAEGRPSLLIGDRVILSVAERSILAPSFEGIIHEVLKDEILLKFCDEFHSSYNGKEYNVRFTFGRTNFRRCHFAADFASKRKTGILFPETVKVKPPQNQPALRSPQSDGTALVVAARPVAGIRRCPSRPQPKVHTGHTFFNETLNARQRSAAFRVLQGQSRPVPYIIYGPPGTGKTVTVVECILQIFCHVPYSRILACTPSNSASDLLTERLHQSGLIHVSDMVRVNAFQRDQENVAECIKPYCSDVDNPDAIKTKRITICTCSTAGAFYQMDLLANHFTHVFVDEAGQATEPECMVPVGLVAGSGGQIVLAGDPLQLGPVLRSNLAKDYGLQISYLERLSTLPFYRRDSSKFVCHGSYDPLLVTKLVENYRSHPALLNLSSELFYDNELAISADKLLTECLCNWEHLPNKNSFPVLFHGIRGQDLREGNSPSWFNPQEAVQVMKYLQSVVHNGDYQLTYDDVGIITPYRKQVEKIRLLINRLGMDKVKVGSVEEFQGQERLVMIISTVRSTESLVSLDLRYTLGFLSNPKRFNVAITRAHALLIVIGNPHVLSQDYYWSKLLQYCVRNDAYIGCDLPQSGCLSVIEGDADGAEGTTDLGTDDFPKKLEDCGVSDGAPRSADLADGTSWRGGAGIGDVLHEVKFGRGDFVATNKDRNEKIRSSGVVAEMNGSGDHLSKDLREVKLDHPSTGKIDDVHKDGLNSLLEKYLDEIEDDRVDSVEPQPANNRCSLSVEDCCRDEATNKTERISTSEDPGTLISKPLVCSAVTLEEIDGSSFSGITSDSDVNQLIKQRIEVNLLALSEHQKCPNFDDTILNDDLDSGSSPDEPVSWTRREVPTISDIGNVERVSTSNESFNIGKPPNPDSGVLMLDNSSFKSPVQVDSEANPLDLTIPHISERGPNLEDNVPETDFPTFDASCGDIRWKRGFSQFEATESARLPNSDEGSKSSDNVDTSRKCFSIGKDGVESDEFGTENRRPVISSFNGTRSMSGHYTASGGGPRPWGGENLSQRQDSRFRESSGYRGRRGFHSGGFRSSFRNSDRGQSRGGRFSRQYRTGMRMDGDVMFTIPDSTENLRRSPNRTFGHFKSALEAPGCHNDDIGKPSAGEVLQEKDEKPVSLPVTLDEPSKAPPKTFPIVSGELRSFGLTRKSGPSVEGFVDLPRNEDLEDSKDDPGLDLERKIIRQMEYYFGDINLMRDAFLKEKIASDPDGWVSLSVIVTFNRMIALSTDFKTICDALRKSTVQIIEVNEDDTRVRRSVSKPLNTDLESWLIDLKDRAAVIKKYPSSETIENMQTFFETFGGIAHIERGIPKQWRQYNGRSGIEMVDLVLFVSPDSVRNLAKKRFTTLKKMGLISLYSDDITNQCVDYFYKRRVLGVPRQNLTPVAEKQNSRNGNQTSRNNPPSELTDNKVAANPNTDLNEGNRSEVNCEASGNGDPTASESNSSLNKGADGEGGRNQWRKTTWKRSPRTEFGRRSSQSRFPDNQERRWRSDDLDKRSDVDKLLSALDNVSFSRRDPASPCHSSDSVLWSSLESSPKVASDRNAFSPAMKSFTDLECSLKSSSSQNAVELNLLDSTSGPIRSHRSRKVKCFDPDGVEQVESPLLQQSTSDVKVESDVSAATVEPLRDLTAPLTPRRIPEMNLDCLKTGGLLHSDAVHRELAQTLQNHDNDLRRPENSASQKTELFQTGNVYRFHDAGHQEYEPMNGTVPRYNNSVVPTVQSSSPYAASLDQQDDDIIIESSCEEILEDESDEECIGGWD